MGNAMLTSVRTCTPTPSCLEAPPCTQVLPTECKRKSLAWLHPPSKSRSLLHQKESTPYGSEDPSWLPSPPSNRCGSQARIRRMRPIHCPQKMLLSYISYIVILFSTCYSCCLTQISSLCLIQTFQKMNKLYENR